MSLKSDTSEPPRTSESPHTSEPPRTSESPETYTDSVTDEYNKLHLDLGLEIKNSTKQSNQYGYHTNNLTDYCGDFVKEYQINYDDPDHLPKKFKVLTWNIWGMIKRTNGEKYMLLNELMIMRMKKVVKEIIDNDPDVIIFQEVGYEALGMIRSFMRHYGILSHYKGFGQNFINYSPDTIEKEIKRDLEIYVFSKYTPKHIIQYTLHGNLGYTTGVIILNFEEINIMGCYLQAGSKKSPGQSDVWFHYARCRQEQLEAIGNIINKECSDSLVILCGDFNMHLDGSESSMDDEWPELKTIKKLKLIDTWRLKYTDKEKYPGYTEDTSINHMRWNMKFMEKHYRYDGIFVNNQIRLHIMDSILVGLKSYPMDDDMFDQFMKTLGNKSLDGEKHRTKTYHPSDHFGVMTSFEIK
jgi:exonuclease III